MMSHKEFSLTDYMVEFPTTKVTGGELEMFAWPGGYAIMYLTKDGDVFCGRCLNERGNLHFRAEIVAVDATCNVNAPEDYTCVQCNRSFGTEI